MFRVGLTGNIASGKSTVAEVWSGLGAPVVDADVLAREAVAPGTPALRAIARSFGPEVLDESGRLDRAGLRRRVFDDPAARRRLEEIVHPAVARLRDEREAALEADGVRIVVHDIPLLFEVGLESEFDRVVLVDAPAEVRLRRLVENRDLPEPEARAMVDAQMPAERKRGKADLIIENGGSLEELRVGAEEVWRRLLSEADASG